MPRTDAGRALDARLSRDDLTPEIEAIEAEAHAQGRAEALAAVRAVVEGLSLAGLGPETDRAAVLAAIDHLETT